MTIFIGPNGSGKTSVLEAIECFLLGKRLKDTDYNSNKPVKIRIKLNCINEDNNCCNILRTFCRGEKAITEIQTDDEKLYEKTEIILNRMQPIITQASKDPADDASEGAYSTLSKLKKEVIQKIIDTEPQIKNFKKKVQDLYKMLENDNSLTKELKKVSRGVSQNSQGADYGIRCELTLDSSYRVEDMPKIKFIMKEGKMNIEVDSAGHGDQQLFSLGLLRYYHENKKLPKSRSRSSESQTNEPIHVFLIDEPELYQHPIRQEAFYENLQCTSKDIQIIYTTHSEKFVSIDWMDNIRIFRKDNGKISSLSVKNKDIRKLINNNTKSKQTADKNHRNTTIHSWNSSECKAALFSRCVVLVEGIDDKIVLETVATQMEIKLGKLGLTVLNCTGKGSISPYFSLFKSFGIDIYTIFDLDNDDDNLNKKLFDLVGAKEQSYKTQVKNNYACFKNNLESQLIDDINDKRNNKLDKNTRNILLSKLEHNQHVINKNMHIDRILDVVQNSDIDESNKEDIKGFIAKSKKSSTNKMTSNDAYDIVNTIYDGDGSLPIFQSIIEKITKPYIDEQGQKSSQILNADSNKNEINGEGGSREYMQQKLFE